MNDDPKAWTVLWTNGVRLGLIPYYMFVERDTGARNYFEVPLVQAFEIFKRAYSQVSGLSRSVRGPSMSAFPGKVRVLGVVTLRDIMDVNVLAAVRESAGFDLLGDPDRSLLVCDFVQARDPAWVRKRSLPRLTRTPSGSTISVQRSAKTGSTSKRTTNADRITRFSS